MTPTPPINSSNPLQALENNGYTVASFVYPIDLATDPSENHMVIFYINQTKGTQFATTPFQPPSSGIGSGGPQINNINNNVTTFNHQNINRISTVIALYIPPNVQSTYSTGWDQQKFNSAGGVAQALSGGLTSDNMTRALKSMAIGGASNFAADASEFAKTTLGADVDIEAAATFVARTIRNPHAEMLFQSIGFREFQFDFKFTPRSQQEALCVSNIIKAFKFSSAPEVKHGSKDERYYVYPSEFDIEFWSGSKPNDFINKISTCALTNMNVNYTGSNGWSSFRTGGTINGMSVETNLSLSFKELEIITKTRINQGY